MFVVNETPSYYTPRTFCAESKKLNWLITNGLLGVVHLTPLLRAEGSVLQMRPSFEYAIIFDLTHFLFFSFLYLMKSPRQREKGDYGVCGCVRDRESRERFIGIIIS